jgi:hypothetical protein
MLWMSPTSSSPVRMRVGTSTSPSRSDSGGSQAQHPDVVVALLLPENVLLHLADQFAHPGIDVVEIAARAGKPHSQIRLHSGIQVAAFQCLFLRSEERRHVVRPFVIREPGAHEHESGDTFRGLEGELQRGVATEGDPDQRGSIDAFGVHCVAYSSSERHRVRLERRVAESGQIDAEHGV